MRGGREERVDDFDGELSSGSLEPPRNDNDWVRRKRLQWAEQALLKAEKEARQQYDGLDLREDEPMQPREEVETLFKQPTGNREGRRPVKKGRSSFVADLFNKITVWLFTSRMFPTILSESLLKRALPDSDSAYSSNYDMELVSTMSVGNSRGRFSGIKELFGFYLLRAFGPDGYNPVNGRVTCADGTVYGLSGEFTYEKITLTSFLLKLFGLPSRPMSLDNEGRPTYSFLQVLYSFAGTSWNPVKETFSGVKEVRGVEFDADMHGHAILDEETGKPKTIPRVEEQDASVYQRRWTQKKVFLVALAVIRVPLFVAFNLVTWPFKFLRNLLKLVTEVLLPVISYGMIKLTQRSFDWLTNFVKPKREDGNLFLQFLWKGFVGAFLIYPVIAIAIAQYAMSLICRIGLAFTSPLTSALLAYESGVLILGQENSKSIFSVFVGVLGFVMSMALSATVWAIAWPLALGGLVTAVPALLTPIAALSQSPFFATVLAWLTQLPIVAGLSTAFGTAFGVVGGALTATFGATITSLGSLVGVTIPQVVLAFSLVMSLVVAPVLTLVTWPVEALSTRIMHWVEGRPFQPLVNWLYSLVGKEVPKEGDHALDAKDIIVANPLYAYQPVKGGMIIVSNKALFLAAQSEQHAAHAVKETDSVYAKSINAVEALKITDIEQGKLLWNKAKAGNGYRFAKDAEREATKAQPAIVEAEKKPAKFERH